MSLTIAQRASRIERAEGFLNQALARLTLASTYSILDDKTGQSIGPPVRRDSNFHAFAHDILPLVFEGMRIDAVALACRSKLQMKHLGLEPRLCGSRLVMPRVSRASVRGVVRAVEVDAKGIPVGKPALELEAVGTTPLKVMRKDVQKRLKARVRLVPPNDRHRGSHNANDWKLFAPNTVLHFSVIEPSSHTCGDSGMRIHVVAPEKTHALDVCPGCPIVHIKERVHQLYPNLFLEDFGLCYGGRWMAPHDTLRKHDVQPQTALTVDYCLSSGTARVPSGRVGFAALSGYDASRFNPGRHPTVTMSRLEHQMDDNKIDLTVSEIKAYMQKVHQDAQLLKLTRQRKIHQRDPCDVPTGHPKRSRVRQANGPESTDWGK